MTMREYHRIETYRPENDSIWSLWQQKTRRLRFTAGRHFVKNLQNTAVHLSLKEGLDWVDCQVTIGILSHEVYDLVDTLILALKVCCGFFLRESTRLVSGPAIILAKKCKEAQNIWLGSFFLVDACDEYWCFNIFYTHKPLLIYRDSILKMLANEPPHTVSRLWKGTNTFLCNPQTSQRCSARSDWRRGLRRLSLCDAMPWDWGNTRYGVWETSSASKLL